MKNSSVKLLGAALLAVSAGGCGSFKGLRQAGDALSLPSLYGEHGSQEWRGARGGRKAGPGDNPCFQAAELHQADPPLLAMFSNRDHQQTTTTTTTTTPVAAHGNATTTTTTTQTTREQIMRGTFLQWCHSALEAENLQGESYIRSLRAAYDGSGPPPVAVVTAAEQNRTTKSAAAPADANATPAAAVNTSDPTPQPSKPNPFDTTTATGYIDQRYLDSGIALSDQICDGYFQGLGLSDTALDAGHSLVGDLGNLTSSLQAATGAPSRAIATSAASFSFVGSTLQNGRKHFTFDGNLQSIYYLVRSTRKSYVDAMRASSQQPSTFWRIYDWLSDYHTSCSAMAIRAMIDDALARRAASATELDNPETRTLNATERANLSAALKLKDTLKDDQITLAVAVALDLVAPNRGLPPNLINPQLDTTDPTTTKATLTDWMTNASRRAALFRALADDGGNAYAAYVARARSAVAHNSFPTSDNPTPPTEPATTPSTQSDTQSPQGGLPGLSPNPTTAPAQ